MKKLHLSLFFSLAIVTASSQKVYFIYIQTESEQSFFIKMNDKIQSSTASGYIILAKLVDSTYNFSVGFPQNKWPEQNFSVTVGKKDHGYLLKNFNEKGWGLFDLQTLSVQMAISGKASIEEKAKMENKDVSVFTEILSKAADDPSLKEKPVQPKVEDKKTEIAIQEVIKKDLSTVAEEPKAEIKELVASKPVTIVEKALIKKEEPKTEVKEVAVVKTTEIIEQPVANKDLPAIVGKAKTEVATKPVEIIDQTVAKQEESNAKLKELPVTHIEESQVFITESYKTSQVKKWSESSTTEGFGLVFIDDYDNGIKDTIRLVIPNPKPVVAIIKEEPKEEKKFLEINTESPQKKVSADSEEIETKEIKSILIESSVEKTILKNNCSEVAAESDFFKLRKKMAAVESDDEMISEAKKYFKIKCFTTSQLKNISTLFLTDEGKYNFFDASYKYVSDMQTFNSLQSELKDEYYTTRFKAMLRN